jgi:hypothetical protein
MQIGGGNEVAGCESKVMRDNATSMELHGNDLWNEGGSYADHR